MPYITNIIGYSVVLTVILGGKNILFIIDIINVIIFNTADASLQKHPYF